MAVAIAVAPSWLATDEGEGVRDRSALVIGTGFVDSDVGRA
jgi:hypothetical protein